MSGDRSSWRRLARALIQLGGRIAPSSRQDWARAMDAELDAVEGDGRALRWAAGCALTCAAERVGAMAVFRSPILRWLLILPLVGVGLSDLFAPIMTLTYRQGWLGATAALGGMTPGDDYHRFIPLMTATPAWLFVLWALAGLLSLFAAWKLARGVGGAYPLFGAVVVLRLLALAVEPLIPGHAELTRQTFTFADPNVVRDVLIPVVKAPIPVVMFLLVWAVELARRARGGQAG